MRERYYDREIEDEIEATEYWIGLERWLERPWFERFNAEILDAGVAAAEAIAEAVYVLPIAEDDDIPF